MVMRRLKIAAFTIITITVLATTVFCADKTFAPEPQRKAWMEKMKAREDALYKKLNLTEDQKRALEINKTRDRERMKALFQQVKDKRAMMRQEIQSDTLNMDKVNQLNAEMKNLEAQILDQRLQGILSVRKILTPEQFKKFTVEIEKHVMGDKDRRYGPGHGPEGEGM
jgi:Spy/CpxP family protein refolding chaperone